MRATFRLRPPAGLAPPPPPPDPEPAGVPGDLALWDRGLRIALGAALAWLAWIAVDGLLAAGLGSVGALFLVTGLGGVCPLYALFGIDSRRLGR